MRTSRRAGFTLIELLVVIAIIGILASMVFPVFARARESARKTVCLSNVKNIALAIQMYLADNNDTLYPMIETRQEVNDYFDAYGGGTDCAVTEMANPYMRGPVVLDEYIKNRDVWRCPSAKVEAGAGFIYGSPDWFSVAMSVLDSGEPDPYGGGIFPCMETSPYPRGWGGAVTDSTVQGYARRYAGEGGEAHKAFTYSLTIFHNAYTGRGNIRLVEVDDPANHIICGDSSGVGEYGAVIGAVAYPDMCGIECANTWGSTDWEMAQSGACDDSLMAPGCWEVWAPMGDSFLGDASLRKPYARHLGGVNLGYLDGHAAWWNSEALLAKFGEEAVRSSSAWGCAPCLFAYEAMGIHSALTPQSAGCDCAEWDTMPHLYDLN